VTIDCFTLVYVADSAADRSINDLTQYPVYPWVISDYTSQSLGEISVNRLIIIIVYFMLSAL